MTAQRHSTRPTPTLRHQRVSLRLARVLDDALDPPIIVVAGSPWEAGKEPLVPDLMVIDEHDQSGPPHLVVEILSDDLATHLIRKAVTYAAAGVERYWVIDPGDARGTAPHDEVGVIVHRLIDGVLVERARHGPGIGVVLDVAPATTVMFDPSILLT